MGRVRNSSVASATTGDSARRQRGPVRLRGREGDLWFMLAVLLVGVVSVAGLQGIANAMSAPATLRAATTAATPPASVSLPQGVVAANAKVFHLPQANPALMTPAVDQQGRVWVGEMGANKLAMLDPATGQISVFPLQPAGGAPAYPYALTITPDGTVWYGDLSGGVVGKLDPATGQVTPYNVGDPKAQIYAMAVGPDGAVWFTELLTDTVGRIDTQTGQVTTVKVPATLGAPATLYNVVTRGDALWFTSTGANALVRYIPGSQQFTFYQLATPSSVPFGLALAPDGALWFSADGTPNYLGRVTP